LLGLEVHGSLGIVLKSAANGLLNYNEARNTLKRLSKTSLWISEKILLEAYEAIEIMFNKKL
jgi:predicted nucleic acid-binding protein